MSAANPRVDLGATDRSPMSAAQRAGGPVVTTDRPMSAAQRAGGPAVRTERR